MNSDKSSAVDEVSTEAGDLIYMTGKQEVSTTQWKSQEELKCRRSC